MSLPRTFALICAFVPMLAVAAPAAGAESLSGGWSGGGKVFYGGTREKASCRARFSKTGGSSYSMSASCATPSGRVDQSASIHSVGANRFSGSFHNSQYGVSGSISISVSGGSMSVSLSGDGGGGSLRLHRN
jgi:hypothetical protein